MMGDGKFAEKPLLYIHQQSTVELPKAQMQHQYFSANKQVQEEKVVSEEPNKTRSRPMRKTYWLEENDLEDEQKLTKHDDEAEEKTKKKFTEMNIEEKIDYFINRSSHGPELRCELKTSDQVFRGVITDYQDNQVFIRVGKRSSSTKVPLASIEEIRLLGF